MGDEGAKPWKKTEVIPRRFDELPPEPEWVPVSDVIRTHRKEEAMQEAKKHKIKPPADSDSEFSDTEDNRVNSNKDEKAVTRGDKRVNSSKDEKALTHEVNVRKKKHIPPRKFDITSVPTTVDDITQSMVDWALNTDIYPKKKTPEHPTHLKEQTNPLAAKQKPSHLQQEKSHTGKEITSRVQPGRLFKDDYKDYASPSKTSQGDNTRPDALSSPGGHKTQANPAGDPRMRTQQPASHQKDQPPIQEEPSPDYDEESYDAYYSRYDDQYYREWGPEDEYYRDERGYEGRGAMDPSERGYEGRGSLDSYERGYEGRGPMDPYEQGYEGRSAMDPNEQGYEGRNAMDPYEQGYEGRSAMDPNEQGYEGRSAMDPNEQGYEGRSAMDPNERGYEGRSAMDPYEQGYESRSAMDPNDRGYEGRSAMDPYLYNSTPYDEYAPSAPQQGYVYPQADFEYGEPQYFPEGQMSGYPQPSHYHAPGPHQH